MGRVCEPIAIAERNTKVCRLMVRQGRAHEVPAFLAGKRDPGPSLATTPEHDVSVQELADDLFETEQRDNPPRAKELQGGLQPPRQEGDRTPTRGSGDPCHPPGTGVRGHGRPGACPRTLRHVRNAVRKLSRFAMFRQLIQANPLDAI